MRKWLKSKWFWLLILLLIIGAALGFWRLSGDRDQTEYVTEPVRRGQLIQTVTATGAVESAQEINLNFKIAGRLVYLGVKEGDQVKAGDVLARLDSSSLAAQVEQHRANLQAARADLERVRSGASTEEINVYQERVIKGENDLSNLESERDTQLKILKEKVWDAADNAAFNIQVTLNKIYNYFVDSGKTANLVVSKYNLLNQVRADYFSFQFKLDQAKDYLITARSAPDNESSIKAADNFRQLLTDFNNYLNQVFELADSIIVNNDYPQTTKDSIKSDINTQQASISTVLTTLQTTRSNLINGINSYQNQIQAAQNNLTIYQAELDLKKVGPRSFEIQAAEAKVAQAQAQLNQALVELNEYQLVAPINGTVTEVNYTRAEQTNLTKSVIKLLNSEGFEIKVDVPESDITKINIGDRTVIELDAFGSDQIFNGRVVFINPAQTVIQEVVYYKVTVAFEDEFLSGEIKPGMTADVTIITAIKDDVIYIPQRAVKIRESILGERADKFVEILINGRVLEKNVETGLRGDGGLIEILSGLTEGEQVITFKRR